MGKFDIMCEECRLRSKCAWNLSSVKSRTIAPNEVKIYTHNTKKGVKKYREATVLFRRGSGSSSRLDPYQCKVSVRRQIEITPIRRDCIISYKEEKVDIRSEKRKERAVSKHQSLGKGVYR